MEYTFVGVKISKLIKDIKIMVRETANNSFLLTFTFKKTTDLKLRPALLDFNFQARAELNKVVPIKYKTE